MFKYLFVCLFLCFYCFAENKKYNPVIYFPDTAHKRAIDKRVANSHLKIFIPSTPYADISRLVNGTLVRLSASKNGWEYYLAYKHKKLSATVYDFWLRKNLKFQDGSALTADSIVENFRAFQKGAFTFTNIHKSLDFVEKIDSHRIRIHLKKPYGMLLNDLARINFYTSSYLKKYSWAKENLADSMREPGANGCGPYILVSGKATGFDQTKKIVLKANPYYYKKEQPYVEKITIFTKLTTNEVIKMISEQEGELDISIIPFDKKTEVVNSKFSKLVTRASFYNFSIHMNLLKKDSILQNKKVRQALNQAIDQERLIRFTYKKEGVPSPFVISANSYASKELSKQYIQSAKKFFSKEQLKEILKGVHLKVVTQDRFISLWRGIEYQLSQYGVSFEFDITTDETYVIKKLLKNREEKYDWDLLIWANDEWYGHPWSVFFALYSKNLWSAVNDKFLDRKFQKLFKVKANTKEFSSLVNEILEYTYEKAYMLAVPSPNAVVALNKEVVFTPAPVALYRLWEAKITPEHWSVREDKKLSKKSEQFILPKRIENDE